MSNLTYTVKTNREYPTLIHEIILSDGRVYSFKEPEFLEFEDKIDELEGSLKSRIMTIGMECLHPIGDVIKIDKKYINKNRSESRDIWLDLFGRFLWLSETADDINGEEELPPTVGEVSDAADSDLFRDSDNANV